MTVYKIPITLSGETKRAIPYLNWEKVGFQDGMVRSIKMTNGSVKFMINTSDFYAPCIEVRFVMGDWVTAEKFFEENIKTQLYNENGMFIGEFKQILLENFNQYIRDINDLQIQMPICGNSSTFIKDNFLYAPIVDLDSGTLYNAPEISVTTFHIYELDDIDFAEIGWEI